MANVTEVWDRLSAMMSNQPNHHFDRPMFDFWAAQVNQPAIAVQFVGPSQRQFDVDTAGNVLHYGLESDGVDTQWFPAAMISGSAPPSTGVGINGDLIRYTGLWLLFDREASRDEQYAAMADESRSAAISDIKRARRRAAQLREWQQPLRAVIDELAPYWDELNPRIETPTPRSTNSWL